MYNKSFILCLFFVLSACTTGSKEVADALVFPKGRLIENPGNIKDLLVGGFSGLHIEKENENLYSLYTVTDRGPNGKEFEANGETNRPFLAPSYSPTILHFHWRPKSQELIKVTEIALKTKKGKPITGFPNISKKQDPKNFDESPVDPKGRAISFDPYGLDTESITKDSNENFWIGDEYGPSLVKVNPKGEIQKRFIPNVKGSKRVGTPMLPGILARRQLNGGLEAIAISDSSLFAILQKPLIGSGSFVPIVELDLISEQVIGLYAYPLKNKKYKIGGATGLPGKKIVIIEQSGDLYNLADQKLYSVDIKSGENFLSKVNSMSIDKAILYKPQLLAKNVLMDLSKKGLYKYEKIEGVSTVDGKTFYLVNDNDFNVKNIMENNSQREPSLLFRTEIKR